MRQARVRLLRVKAIGAALRGLVTALSVTTLSALAVHPAQASTKHETHTASAASAARRDTHRAGHDELASRRHETTHERTRLAATRHESGTREASYHAGHGHYAARKRLVRYARYRHSGLQCVPYAREVSHIDLSGDAFLWWAEASGRYARGDVPQEGAVLNFRAIGRMPLGHVAVVTDVVDSRTILVTQANWVRGTITNDVTVQDVSPDNDWSEVQVELGDSRTWGAAYPTYGFIYNQPATTTVIAARAQRGEVAEAPSAATIAADAPDRDLQ